MVPVVVLTKTDLVDDVSEWMATVRLAAPGVDVIAVSLLGDGGLEELEAHMAPGETIALLGSSGVGKSTLLNRLSGDATARTGDVRDDGRGRHTTTHRELVRLPSGVMVIDTPGMRELRLWVGQDGIEQTFADVALIADNCRFDDCTHRGEPNCAVEVAIERGELPKERLESWRKLSREQARVEISQDPAARGREKSRVKSLTKALRERLREKRGDS